MIYALALTALLVCFLIDFMRYTKGKYRTQILIGLSVACFIILIAVFLTYGWKETVVFSVGMLLALRMLEPVAVRLAARVLATTNLVSYYSYPGLPSRRLKKISHRLVSSGSSNVDELVDYCVQNPDVLKILDDFDFESDDLKQLYDNLISVGAGQWRGGHFVAASSLAYPNCLRFLVENSGGESVPDEIAYNLLMHFECGAALGSPT